VAESSASLCLCGVVESVIGGLTLGVSPALVALRAVSYFCGGFWLFDMLAQDKLGVLTSLNAERCAL
jgi:hypothetical protein